MIILKYEIFETKFKGLKKGLIKFLFIERLKGIILRHTYNI